MRSATDVEDRIRFLQGDLLAPVAGELFEIVVSNPPYVPNTDRALIAVEVREYEPALALFAGEDGLDVYRRLIPAAHARSFPAGFIALEIGYRPGETRSRDCSSERISEHRVHSRSARHSARRFGATDS